ncbi:membrane protein [Microbacterium mitrae]|uniref:Polysaccharide biosynthesis protein n=1 Tax=Microbacterium mitrae TaxID=664640 RepID=A0A5C8HSS2_9MICO|nr:hypothetical protein [Microbacterium mitrae]TXK06103.1 hypothetical protein FVP60_03815 [Microbacterium mitrae]
MTSEDSPDEPTVGRGALSLILIATVIAGAIGYLIQGVVPGFLGAADYATFGAFWAITYLLVSALSGVQQELTRVSHTVVPNDSRARWPLAARFILATAIIAAVIVAVVFFPLSETVLGKNTAGLAAPLAIAVFGYTLVAGLSAALYGTRNWRGVAAMTVADSAIRLILMAGVLALGLGMTALGWAVALPFLLAAVILFLVVGGRVRRQLRVDATARTLVSGTLSTVAAAFATGILISGLPFLLRASASATDVTLVASLMLVITLTRAPLVVPVMALQSYLIVQFRARPEHARATVMRYAGMLFFVAAMLATVAAWIGPGLLQWLYRGEYALGAVDFAIIVLSAGLTGVMCITAPAVLAVGKHAAYVSGWALAAVITIATLFLPLGNWHAQVLAAIVLAPAAGAVFHLLSLRPQPNAA